MIPRVLGRVGTSFNKNIAIIAVKIGVIEESGEISEIGDDLNAHIAATKAITSIVPAMSIDWKKLKFTFGMPLVK